MVQIWSARLTLFFEKLTAHGPTVVWCIVFADVLSFCVEDSPRARLGARIRGRPIVSIVAPFGGYLLGSLV